MTKITSSTPLSLFTRLVYGSGDWSIASFGTLRQIFYAIFLTDVVGLDARLASFAALIGILWDAVNDPIVGTLSDRIRTRWGRRRPFLLFFSIPFGLSFLLLWWAPPWESQIARMVTVMLAFMISDTFQTLVTVPFYALMPEITSDYDQRTSLAGYRMIFNLLASLATAVSAPMIVKAGLHSGWSLQQGYLVVSALFGGLAILPFLAIFFSIREKNVNTLKNAQVQPPFLEIARTAWRNKPFRFATVLYMLNWITFDLVALMLPFYLTYWIARGNLVAAVPFLGDTLALESLVLGLLLVTAVVAVPLWTWLARRLDKRTAYMLGMSFWVVVQLLIFSLQPGEINRIVLLAVLAGLSVSTAHVLPDAIFPDVIEWDELRTGQRHEGIYYGVKNFVRKLTGALGWFGYQTPPAGVTQFAQTPSALAAIRFMTGPVGALLLVSAVVMAWFYPLTRDRHTRILNALARRRQKAETTIGD
jgi:GPH family glycoside/pentoside/hexuronide:cation symporter